jgi:folylpolyglutamate synthase/dihydropteroate synthase
MDPERLAAIYASHGIEVHVCDGVESAIESAKHCATELNVPILIAGSVYLAGAVLDGDWA